MKSKLDEYKEKKGNRLCVTNCSNKYNNQDIEVLCSIIAEKHNFEKIDLSLNQFSEEHSLKIIEQLENQSQLQSIDFGGNSVCSKSLVILAKLVIKNQNHLQVFRLNNIRSYYNNRDLIALIKSFNSSKLIEIHFGYNPLDNSIIKELADFIKHSKFLKILKLPGCNISDSGANILLRVIKPPFELLDLRKNFIQHSGQLLKPKNVEISIDDQKETELGVQKHPPILTHVDKILIPERKEIADYQLLLERNSAIRENPIIFEPKYDNPVPLFNPVAEVEETPSPFTIIDIPPRTDFPVLPSSTMGYSMDVRNPPLSYTREESAFIDAIEQALYNLYYAHHGVATGSVSRKKDTIDHIEKGVSVFSSNLESKYASNSLVAVGITTVKLTTMIATYLKDQRSQEEAKRVQAFLGNARGMNKKKLEKIVYVMLQRFRDQINSIQMGTDDNGDNGIQKLADCIAIRIIKYASSGKNNPEMAIEKKVCMALYTERNDDMANVYIVHTNSEDFQWRVKDIFENTGIKLIDNPTKLYIYQSIFGLSKSTLENKYGFCYATEEEAKQRGFHHAPQARDPFAGKTIALAQGEWKRGPSIFTNGIKTPLITQKAEKQNSSKSILRSCCILL